MQDCPCGSGLEYGACCRRFHDGQELPSTAEALMRARYSAFAKHRVEFVSSTLHPSKRAGYNESETRDWSRNSDWKGLEVLRTEDGGAEDTHGVVEFIAHYVVKDQMVDHHEVAEFRKKDDQWYFYDGKVRGGDPIVRDDEKVGRNDPCPCGSGKKYKKCCG